MGTNYEYSIIYGFQVDKSDINDNESGFDEDLFDLYEDTELSDTGLIYASDGYSEGVYYVFAERVSVYFRSIPEETMSVEITDEVLSKLQIVDSSSSKDRRLIDFCKEHGLTYKKPGVYFVVNIC